MVEKRGQKEKLTILIDKEIKNKYRNYCDLKGLVLGKQIELFLESELMRIDDEEKKVKK